MRDVTDKGTRAENKRKAFFRATGGEEGKEQQRMGDIEQQWMGGIEQQWMGGSHSLHGADQVCPFCNGEDMLRQQRYVRMKSSHCGNHLPHVFKVIARMAWRFF